VEWGVSPSILGREGQIKSVNFKISEIINNLSLMKKAHKSLVFSLFLLGFMALSQIGYGQFPPPPPSGDKGGNNNGVPGGGAPIGSGMVLLISLAAGYGAKKVYQAKKRLTE
jgi:hypothetical protein